MPTRSHIVLTVSDGASATEEFTIENVNIEAYHAEAEMAEDSMTPKGSRFSITATGLVAVESWMTIQTNLSRMGNRAVSVEMPHPDLANETLISLVNTGSDIGGPFVKMTGTQVVGEQVVLVRMEITDRLAVCASPIVSHVWTQRMSTDAAGHTTRSVQGIMTVSRAAANSSTAQVPIGRDVTPWVQTIPWGDLFRRAVIPALPAYGWRRESQDYAFDAQSTSLIYTVTDKQYAHDLPDGVRVGDMEFSYERSLENPAIANCSFSCDLQGEPSLRNLDYSGAQGTRGNRVLVTAAVELAKTRINSVYGHCLITRMRVTEKGILSGYSIRFEMDAQMFPDAAAGSNVIAPMAWMIGRGFTVTRTTSRELDAYGSAVRNVVNGTADTCELYTMVPHYLNNAINGMSCEGSDDAVPYATVYTLDAAEPALGTITVTMIQGSSGFGTVNDPQSGGFNGKFSGAMQQGANQGGFITVVSHNVSLTSVKSRTGLCRLTTMYKDAPDHIFQVTKPEVRITERLEVSRVNKAPPRTARALPAGAYVISEDWNVSYGRFDAQGNRIFTGVYERTYGIYDVGGTMQTPSAPNASGFYAITPNFGPFNGDVLRGWMSYSAFVNPTLSPMGTDASQYPNMDVFGLNTDLDTRYLVPSLPLVS